MWDAHGGYELVYGTPAQHCEACSKHTAVVLRGADLATAARTLLMHSGHHMSKGHTWLDSWPYAGPGAAEASCGTWSVRGGS